jgi:hypothetical protein
MILLVNYSILKRPRGDRYGGWTHLHAGSCASDEHAPALLRDFYRLRLRARRVSFRTGFAVPPIPASGRRVKRMSRSAAGDFRLEARWHRREKAGAAREDLFPNAVSHGLRLHEPASPAKDEGSRLAGERAVAGGPGDRTHHGGAMGRTRLLPLLLASFAALRSGDQRMHLAVPGCSRHDTRHFATTGGKRTAVRFPRNRLCIGKHKHLAATTRL